MPGSQHPYATDANVLFDVHRGGVLTVTLRAIDCRVPDFVLDECEEPTRRQVLAAGAREETFSSAEVRELMEIRRDHGELSLADASVFLVARRCDGVVLTRDEPLETLASEKGMTVIDTVDLLDLLSGQRHLSRARAVEAVERMIERDRPLSTDKAHRFIERWRG